MMKYAICNIELLDEVTTDGEPIFDFSQVIQEGKSTLRLSNDGQYFLVKWIGPTPIFLNDVDTYTHAEIKVALNNDNWKLEI
ncbi:MAG: hypothetical protein CML17_03725 [Pusillimonas sp.]|nr:hypothetical protein [Pusillimonas sp.]